ncbi:MAG: type II/IV secretion system ATPase subunit, partial [Thermoplasmatota archaeon]
GPTPTRLDASSERTNERPVVSGGAPPPVRAKSPDPAPRARPTGGVPRPASADVQPATPTTHNTPTPIISSPEPRESRKKGFLTNMLPQPRERRRPDVDAQTVTAHPPAGPGEKIVEIRPIRPPYSYVRVIFEEELGRYRYEVLEPQLTPEESEAFQFVRDAFVRTLDVDMTRLDREGAREYLIEQYEALVSRHSLRLSDISRARVGYYLEREFLGFGLIDAMMSDPNIEDISCDGPNIPLFIYHRKYESIRTNMSFASDDELDAFVMQTVQRSGKHISVAEPLVDATLPDGSRLQASLSREVTTRGSTFTIRKFRQDPFTPTDLLTFETASPEMLAFLWLAVERGASALICGGTASGKTTTLNAMSIFIPPHKKIISIEDTREINLQHENWIPGVTRAGGIVDDSSDGHRTGEVDMYDLLRAAVRQRPDYILLGEVRGREAYVLFQAMATGHTVFSTMHADSVPSAVHRLESKPIEIPRNMLSGLDLFIIQGETRQTGKRVRRLREITELTGIDPRTGEILTNRVFAWDPASGGFRTSGSSVVIRKIAEEQGVTEGSVRQELERRMKVLTTLRDRGIRDIARVSRVVTAYAIDPERAVRMLTSMNQPAAIAAATTVAVGGGHGSS